MILFLLHLSTMRGMEPCDAFAAKSYHTGDSLYKEGQIERSIPFFIDAASGFACRKNNLPKYLRVNQILSWYLESWLGDYTGIVSLLDTVLGQLWEPPGEIDSESRLAWLYADYCMALYLTGKFGRAYNQARYARDLFENSPFYSTDLRKTLMERIIHIQGLSAFRLGDYQLAQEVGTLLKDYYKKHKSYDDAVESSLLGSSAASESGRYRESIGICEEALKWQTRDPAFKGRLNTNMGYAYYKLKNYPKTIEHGERALLTYEAILQKQPERADSIAVINSKYETHNLLGLTWNELGKLDKAISHFQDAYNCIELAYKGLDRAETLRTWVYLARAYLSKDQIELALEGFHEGLRHAVPDFDTPDVRLNPHNLLQAKDPFLVFALAGKADCWLSKYKMEGDTSFLTFAITTYQQAFDLDARLKWTYLKPHSKYLSGEKHRPFYEDAVFASSQMYSLTKSSKHLAQALQFVERNKAYVLWESISKASMGQLESNHQDFHARVFDIYSLDEVQQSMVEDQSLMLTYFTTEKHLYAFAINSDSASLISIDKPVDFEARLDSFVRLISIREEASDEKMADNYYDSFVAESRYWYQLLLEPFLKNIQSGEDSPKQLIIIPEGKLSNLPFEVLLAEAPDVGNKRFNINKRFRDLAYLLKNYRVRYGYSMNTLLKQRAVFYASEIPYVGFAPSYNTDEVRHLEEEIISLIPLSWTESHVMTIAGLLNGKAFVDKQASIRNFDNYSDRSNIIQLIMHGKANEGVDLMSWLAFVKDSTIGQGLLLARDIYIRKIKTNLLILTSCQSGQGRIQIGEGKMSIARAFLQAGCPNIVNSLWNVNEKVAASLIESFMKHLKNGQTLDMALRNAKLDFMGVDKSRPYYWATFTLIGNDNILFQPEVKSGHSWLGVIWLIIGGFLAAWVYRKLFKEGRQDPI